MPMYKDLPKALKKAGYVNIDDTLRTASRRLLSLNDGLETAIPSLRESHRVHIATFNIKDFCYTGGKYARSRLSLFFLAELIHPFDIVAVQEIKGDDESDFRMLMSILGPDYDYRLSKTPKDDFPHKERMAYIYNKRKVRPTRESYNFRQPEIQDMQYARRPFVGRFQSGWLKLELHSVHLPFQYGNPKRRMAECEALAHYYGTRNPTQYHTVLLGDFNTPTLTCESLNPLFDAGFTVPEPLTDRMGSNVDMDKHYDHILCRKACESDFFNVRGGGVFNYYDYVYTDTEECRDFHYEEYRITAKESSITKERFHAEYHTWRKHQMSDHLLLWLALETNNAREYLRAMAPKNPVSETILDS